MTSRAPLGLVLACLLIGCQAGPKPTQVNVRASVRPTVAPVVVPTKGPATGLITNDGGGLITNDGGGLITNDGGGIISRDGAGIISRDGAGIISRDGAGISGVAKLPAGIISRDGAGLINNGGSTLINNGGSTYHLAAVTEDVPIRDQLVYLLDAKGRLVLGPDDQPITAKTDAQGHFSFQGLANQKNMLLAVELYGGKGRVQLVLPRGETTREVALGLASTLTATYIQEQFLKPQADPVAVFERLPADLEAATRASVAAAAAKAPADLSAATVVATVDQLRGQAKAVDDQFAEVKRVLLAGLSNQGIGQPADTLEFDASALALSSTGQLVFCGRTTHRVWRKDEAGTLQPVAGSGGVPPRDGSAPGDGGPATQAPMDPRALAYAKDGSLLVADAGTQRVRRVAADGTISTVAQSLDWKELRGLYEEPDGSLVVATHAALYRVPPGGTPTVIAGVPRPWDQQAEAAAPTLSAGDGGKPTDARFYGITGLARDPKTGDALVYDGYEVRRITATTIQRVAGALLPGYSGDDGPADGAALYLIGSVGVQADGTILIADTFNYRLRRVAGGTISTLAGTGQPGLAGEGGPAKAAALAGPQAIAPAADGSVYFVDQGHVRRLADGVVTTLVGGTRGFDKPRPATQVQLLAPRHLTYDPGSHAMWVNDLRHVWRWDLAANTLVSIFGGGLAGQPFAEGQAATATNLFLPTAPIPLGADKFATLTTDAATQLGRGVIVEGEKLTTILGGAAAVTADYLTDGPAAGIFVSGTDADLVKIGDWYYYDFALMGQIKRFQPGGKTEAFGQGLALGQITTMAKGPDDQLYVGTAKGLWRLDPATGRGVELAKDAAPTQVVGLAWDAAGNLYFSEVDAARVRRLRKDTGAVELVAGSGAPALNGTTVDTGLASPTGLAFDRDGVLYVADAAYGQIKVVRKP